MALPGESYARLILGVLDGVKWITQQLHDQKMIGEGEARAVKRGLEKANEKIKAALAARDAVAATPDERVRDPDGDQRAEP